MSPNCLINALIVFLLVANANLNKFVSHALMITFTMALIENAMQLVQHKLRSQVVINVLIAPRNVLLVQLYPPTALVALNKQLYMKSHVYSSVLAS